MSAADKARCERNVVEAARNYVQTTDGVEVQAAYFRLEAEIRSLDALQHDETASITEAFRAGVEYANRNAVVAKASDESIALAATRYASLAVKS